MVGERDGICTKEGGGVPAHLYKCTNNVLRHAYTADDLLILPQIAHEAWVTLWPPNASERGAPREGTPSAAWWGCPHMGHTLLHGGAAPH